MARSAVTAATPADCGLTGWECPEPLSDDVFAGVRRRMVLRYFKWDPQVGDVSTLAPFPLILPQPVVRDLRDRAEVLFHESITAEQRLLERPALLRQLGLPRPLQRLMGDGGAAVTPIAARVIRFDFHPTADGWRISEANSDVPGGYSESSHFPRLVAEHYPGTRPTGDPAGDLAGAVSARAGSTGRAVLVAAPGYLEDFQVIACLADALRHRGWQTRFAHPGQVEWEKGRARVRSPGGSFSPDLVVRFLQGEWLVRLPARRNWGCLVRGGLTPVCNPGTALVTESKRFPVVWDALGVPLPTWRALLPETRDPRDVDWRHDDRWLLKGAFSNNGDEVIDRRWSKPRDWRAADWSVWLRPRAWAAQRRFETLPLGTPVGPLYPCLGVYVIDGRFAGIYGRLAPRPLIDFAAVDVAVLVRDEVSHAT